jgi:hypothetical protein
VTHVEEGICALRIPTIWIRHIMKPVCLRRLIVFEQLPCHDCGTFDDLSWSIVKPSLIIGDIVLLEEVEGNVVVKMVL